MVFTELDDSYRVISLLNGKATRGEKVCKSNRNYSAHCRKEACVPTHHVGAVLPFAPRLAAELSRYKQQP